MILLALWLFNLWVGISFAKKYGQDNEWHANMIKNSNNIFYCFFSLAGIAIAQYVFKFAIYIVLGWNGICGVLEAIALVTGIIAQIAIEIYDRRIEPAMWLTAASNLLCLLSDAVIFYFALRTLLSWG